MKSCIYICKCRWINNRTGEVIPVLKYGRTKNINTRMDYYNKNGVTYELIKTFPLHVRKLKNIEGRIHAKYHWKEYLGWKYDVNGEHITFKTNALKELNIAIIDAIEQYERN